jgi:hypothetical protein
MVRDDQNGYLKYDIDVVVLCTLWNPFSTLALVICIKNRFPGRNLLGQYNIAFVSSIVLAFCRLNWSKKPYNV